MTWYRPNIELIECYYYWSSSGAVLALFFILCESTIHVRLPGFRAWTIWSGQLLCDTPQPLHNCFTVTYSVYDGFP